MCHECELFFFFTLFCCRSLKAKYHAKINSLFDVIVSEVSTVLLHHNINTQEHQSLAVKLLVRDANKFEFLRFRSMHSKS